MNDIKTLPFDQIKPKALEAFEAEKEDMIEHIFARLTSRYNSRVAEVARILETQFGNYEEGSDGYIEDAREEVNPPDKDDIELDEEAERKLKDDALYDVLERFLKFTNLPLKHTWALPQMVAHFGREWKAVRNEAGLINGQATVMLNTKNNFDFGLWAVATRVERKNLATWSKGQHTWYSLYEYNHLVPLILNGFKLYQNINYSEWDRDTLHFVVDKALCDAMLTIPPKMSVEDKLKLRQHGLMIASGTKKGELRKPETTFGLAHLDSYTDYDLSGLNTLSQLMLVQLHDAHPTNAKPRYQVLDPSDWDATPSPLVITEVIDNSVWSASYKPKKTVSKDTPW